MAALAVIRRRPCHALSGWQRVRKDGRSLLILLAVMVGTAQAAERVPVPDRPAFRFGLAVQDPTSPEQGAALRAEILLPKPDALTKALPDVLVPAPLAGLSAFLGHGTSFLYAGALWTVPIAGPFFVEGSLSVAANNGVSEPGQGRAALGCRGGFREEAGLGWRIDADWSAILMVEHYSNAHLCNHNRGLTNFGVLIGRSF